MRFFDVLQDLMAACAAGILMVVMCSVAADVTLRAFSLGSLTWALELSEHSLLVMVFLGMPWLAREGGHIAVELVTARLNPDVRRSLSRVVAIGVSLLLFWLTFWAFRLALADWQSNIRTIGLYPVPRSLVSVVLGIGLFLTGLEYLRQAVTGHVADPSRESVA